MRHLVWLSGVLLTLSCTVNGSNLNVDASGTGGSAATGGKTGAGGTSATGGATGGGGQPGTGGDGQAGGTTGAGGSATGAGGSATGTGGSATGAGGSATGTGGSGVGGSTGMGGSGAGGSATGAGGSGTGGGKGGKGGQGGQGGNPSCDKLASDYTNAMTAAKACTPGATNQCQTLVNGTIGCSSCRQYVNDATMLNAIQDQWESDGCAVGHLCSAIACVTPPSTCTGSGPITGGPGGGANPAGTCSGGLLTAAR